MKILGQMSKWVVLGQSSHFTPLGAPIMGVLSFSAATEQQPYSYTPTVTGGAPTSWTLQSGSLPVWLSFNTATGEFSGTPQISDPDVVGISVQCSNVAGASLTSNVDTITITDILLAPNFTIPLDILDGTIGTTYNISLAALNTGGLITAYSLATGTLPAGLTLNTLTGFITGTVTTEETQAGISFTGTNATDSSTTNTDSVTITGVVYGVITTVGGTIREGEPFTFSGMGDLTAKTGMTFDGVAATSFVVTDVLIGDGTAVAPTTGVRYDKAVGTQVRFT